MPTQYNRKYRDDVPDYLKGTKYTAPEKGDRTYDELKRNLDKSGMSMDEFEKWNNDKLSGRTDMNWEQYVEKRDATPDQKRYAAGQRYTDNEYYTDTYEPQVEDELAKYRQQMQGNLRDLKQQTNFAQERNNQYLDEQLKQYQRDQAQDKSQITALQNRRGGFYSGGLDYQLGQNNQAYTQARSGLTRDVASRNAELNDKYQNVAQDAYTKLSQLQQQAPDRVRELVQQALQGDREAAIAESKITGMYNGQPTLEAQKIAGDQAIDQGLLDLKQTDQEFQQQVELAALTGYLPNGQPTSEEEQRQIENLWEMSERTGVIHPQLAQLYGIPEGTPTWEAQQDMIQNNLDKARIDVQKTNAATSRMNAGTSRMNANTSRDRLTWQKEQANQPSSGGGYSGGEPQGDAGESYDYVNELSKRFVNVNDNGEQVITNPQGLYNSILTLGLSENETAALVEYYGLGEYIGR